MFVRLVQWTGEGPCLEVFLLVGAQLQHCVILFFLRITVPVNFCSADRGAAEAGQAGKR